MTEKKADDTGRIVAFKNPAHEPGSKQPAFKGSITLEGSTDKRPLALWARKSKKTGKTFFIGKAGESAVAQIEKIAEPPTTNEDSIEQSQTTGTEFAVDPHEVILFPNSRKTEGSKQHDYFGYYNPGDGSKLQRVDVWAKNDRYGKPMLSGNVTEHKQAKKLEQTNDDEDTEQRPTRKRAASR